MKLLIQIFLMTTILILTSASVSAKPKSNPFNEEGPQCIGIKCLIKEIGIFDILLIGKADKKPPFNDEGPGGKKDKKKSA